MSRWIVIIIALLGLAMGAWTVMTATTKAPPPAPVQPPSVNPFPSGIAATGIVEAASRNIEIAAPEAGRVEWVNPKAQVRAQTPDATQPDIGMVRRGDVLFKLETRTLDAELLKANAALKIAEAQEEKLKLAPRPEDIPPLEAIVAQRQAELLDAQEEYDQWQKMKTQSAATEMEAKKKEYALARAKAAVDGAQRELDKMKAGTWQPDLAVAAKQVAAAKADRDAIQIRIDRMSVRPPALPGVAAWTVLKRNVEPGEYAMTGQPAMVLGDVSTLHVRAQVDEEDAPRLLRGAHGEARLRGGMNIKVPLRWLRIEPLAQAKQQLTGATVERVDTRVIEVVFEVVGKVPENMFPGQLVDVFIDTSEPTTTRPAE